LTKPISEGEVVLGKYLAAVILIGLALLPTLLYVWAADRLSTSVTAVPASAYAARHRLHLVLSVINGALVVGALARSARGAGWRAGGWAWQLLLALCWIVLFALVTRWMLFIGGVDAGATWGAYIGLFLLAACFASIGLLASALTDSQIVAFLIAVVLCFLLYMGFDLLASFDALGGWEGPIKAIGIQHHYQSLGRGVLDLGDVLYHLGVIAIFLLLTRAALQSRAW
ncbi:MAG: ABC transporter permease, partial [Flavobacteriales bacterium]